MPYEITLRPKSTSLVDPESMRDDFLSLGMRQHPDSIPPGLLSDGVCMIEISLNPNDPGRVHANIKLPYSLPLEDFCEEILTLALVAQIMKSDLLDGDEKIEIIAATIVSSGALKEKLSPVCERYLRSSKAAEAIFGTIAG